MKKIKKLFGWALFLILAIIISELLINVALNSSYKSISRKDSTAGVEVYQAEATLVNGRIRGIVENTGSPNIEGKYLKVDIFSERDVNLGTKYIKLEDLKVGEKDSFEIFYKLQNSSYYKISVVDKEEPVDNSPFFPKDFAKRKILLWVALAIVML